MDEVDPGTPPGVVAAPDDLTLLRAFEPVLCMTMGESFFPVDVAPYVATAALWRTLPDGEASIQVGPGELDLVQLAAVGSELFGPGHSLSVISTGADESVGRRKKLRDRRQRLKGGSRLAEVGILGRTIDAASRLSLLFRGSVPGGSAAASQRVQDDCLSPDRATYFGRVVRDGGYLICQYWFFYSFNNWRSGFGGVNEHEADWEQVTVFLDGTGVTEPDGLPIPRWVVFSAHDETGDDLRRRWDDPDLTLVDGRHPVVYAGVGSHSGAYLAGDYLITVEPPSLGGVVKATRRVARVLTPWSTSARGVGIPYIDYARGDGRRIGPGETDGWHPVVIGDTTPWVVGYRGLWGHDTRDRLGGERGPAGPRYERDGTVRASWADPVGWAGLSKVPPNPALAQQHMAARAAMIEAELVEIDARVTAGREELRTRTAGLGPEAPAVRAVAGSEAGLLGLRRRAAGLADERERLDRASRAEVAIPGVHAHLSHRMTPIERGSRARERLLAFWAVVSTPLILWMLGRLVLPTGTTRTAVLVATLVLLLGVEALARGYFLAFLLRAAAVLAVGYALIWAVRDWQEVLATAFAVLAIVVLVVNVRDALRR